MRPSGVRQRILDEHKVIRERLDELEALADALDRDGPAALERALERAREFYSLLSDHIELENSILVPALRQVDAWGQVRAEKLLTHHSEQQTELRELTSQAASPIEAGTFTSRLRRLIADVRDDMVHEEGGVLSDELLKDDLISVHEGG